MSDGGSGQLRHNRALVRAAFADVFPRRMSYTFMAMLCMLSLFTRLLKCKPHMEKRNACTM